MSTTFGICIGKEFDLVDDCLPESAESENFVEVAFRGNGGRLHWLNDLAPILTDEIKVYPLDNSAQGILTIGDIKSKMEEQNYVR